MGFGYLYRRRCPHYQQPSIMTLADGVAFLAEQRKVPDRSQSAKVVAVGEELLSSGTLNKIGDEVWPALEQLAYAALDVGHRDLAIACIERVAFKFPISSRTKCLQGALLESGTEPETALKFYDVALVEDPADALVTKRRIAVLRSLGQNEMAIEALNTYVDNFYSDSEAWLELASLYTEVGLLDRACFALEECVLLQPTNSFFSLQLAETLYTCGNINRAYKTFLQVIELDVDPADEGHPPAAGGPRLRALWGLKLVCIDQPELKAMLTFSWCSVPSGFWQVRSPRRRTRARPPNECPRSTSWPTSCFCRHIPHPPVARIPQA